MSSSSYSVPRKTRDRDDNVREVEKKARERKQDAFQLLMSVISTIPAEDYRRFLQKVGDPLTHGGQLAQWQVISIATQAIAHYLNQSIHREREQANLAAKIQMLENTLNQAMGMQVTQYPSYPGIGGYYDSSTRFQ